MFIYKHRPIWGFVIGFGSVGIPGLLLLLVGGEWDNGIAWLVLLVPPLLGGVWASVLSLLSDSTDVRRAAHLGAYAWMAVLVCLSILFFVYWPWLILTLPLAGVFGAGMGAMVESLLRWAGLRTTPGRLTPPQPRDRI